METSKFVNSIDMKKMDAIRDVCVRAAVHELCARGKSMDLDVHVPSQWKVAAFNVGLSDGQAFDVMPAINAAITETLSFFADHPAVAAKPEPKKTDASYWIIAAITACAFNLGLVIGCWRG